jgi:hypothetical protein
VKLLLQASEGVVCENAVVEQELDNPEGCALLSSSGSSTTRRGRTLLAPSRELDNPFGVSSLARLAGLGDWAVDGQIDGVATYLDGTDATLVTAAHGVTIGRDAGDQLEGLAGGQPDLWQHGIR